MRKQYLLGSAASIVALAGAAQFLGVSSAAAQAQAAASQAEATGASSQIGEIVVTANKREENLQDVAASVQAI